MSEDQDCRGTSISYDWDTAPFLEGTYDSSGIMVSSTPETMLNITYENIYKALKILDKSQWHDVHSGFVRNALDKVDFRTHSSNATLHLIVGIGTVMLGLTLFVFAYCYCRKRYCRTIKEAIIKRQWIRGNGRSTQWG